MENKNEPIIYKGFEIYPIFNYDNGRSDFNVFAPGWDYGYMAANQTLAQVEIEIDEKLSDL